jgi:hypothetical protein
VTTTFRKGQRVTTTEGGRCVVVEILPGPSYLYRLQLDTDVHHELAALGCYHPTQLAPTTLVYHLELFDADGELTQSTCDLGPLDVLVELGTYDGLSEAAAVRVFPVLAAPGEVSIGMLGGWSFRLTSEEEL